MKHLGTATTIAQRETKPLCLGERFVVRQGRLNEKQLKVLSDELATLMKEQYEARLLEVFIPMSKKEIEAFDLRTEGISRIHVILSEHDANR